MEKESLKATPPAKEEVLEYIWGSVEIVGLGVFREGVAVKKAESVEYDASGVVVAVPEEVFNKLKESQFFKVKKQTHSLGKKSE